MKSLFPNIDETPLKLAPILNRTVVILLSNSSHSTKNCKHVHVTGFSYTQAIIGTFGITLSNEFQPMQLIYDRKTTQRQNSSFLIVFFDNFQTQGNH